MSIHIPIIRLVKQYSEVFPDVLTAYPKVFFEFDISHSQLNHVLKSETGDNVVPRDYTGSLIPFIVSLLHMGNKRRAIEMQRYAESTANQRSR